MSDPAMRGYIVFREVEPGLWCLIGEVNHRPGLAARTGRGQAVRDATGGADPGDGVFAALPRDQWHVASYG
jgi:hypothetical protein